MTDMMYKITVTAVGEVRDADGNLVESFPVESERLVSEAELREMQGASE